MTILMYSKSYCGWCDEVKGFFQEHKIPVEVKEVDLDAAAYRELVERTGQSMAPTLVFENGDILKDTDAEEVERYMRAHGLLAGSER